MNTPNTPTYLRVVATTRCNMECKYCHMEGDPQQAGTATELGTDELCTLLGIAVRGGVRKLKFLGGEPFMRRDLPQVIRHVRTLAPDLDISAITAGALPERVLHEAFDAGLSRVNMSIHGFDFPAFEQRGGRLKMWHDRKRFLAALLATGRPVKLNYVLSGVGAREDLGVLLDAAAHWPAVISVLDDLNDPHAGPGHVIATVEALRGPADERFVVPDPDSLATTHLRWHDGLEVEIKDQRLGDIAPYGACLTCPTRSQCREGILALRLLHDGRLQPCLDRPDLALDLVGILRRQGEAAALEAWRAYGDLADRHASGLAPYGRSRDAFGDLSDLGDAACAA